MEGTATGGYRCASCGSGLRNSHYNGCIHNPSSFDEGVLRKRIATLESVVKNMRDYMTGESQANWVALIRAADAALSGKE